MDQLNISDKYMVTFDVCPLFTSIQLEETIDIICEQSELLLLMCLLNSE